jgi:hypothetical protein
MAPVAKIEKSNFAARKEKSMKKAVWLAFGAAILGVNAAAEAVEYFTDTELVAYFRVMLIMGVLFIAMIFLGAYALVSAAEEEKPLAGSVHNTLGTDGSRSEDTETVSSGLQLSNTTKVYPNTNPASNLEVHPQVFCRLAVLKLPPFQLGRDIFRDPTVRSYHYTLGSGHDQAHPLKLLAEEETGEA